MPSLVSSRNREPVLAGMEALGIPAQNGAPPRVFDFSGEKRSSHGILIDAATAVVGGEWTECHFVVEGESSLAFRGAQLKDCQFTTHMSHRSATLSVNECKVQRITIDGDWGTVQFVKQANPVRKSTFDQQAVEFNAPSVTFDGCRITAFVEHWQTNSATFRDCHWEPIITDDAELSFAQFHGSTVVVGDWTNVCSRKNEVNLQTARHIRDDWAELKSDYTGIRLYIILLLTGSFLLPYLGKAWVLSLAAGVLRDRGIAIDWVPLWRAIIFPAGQGVALSVLAMLLIGYNVGRAWLTLHVARLREREAHLLNTGFTAARPALRRKRLKMPLLRRTIALSPILIFHRVLGVLFYLSAASALVRTLQFLLQRVPVF